MSETLFKLHVSEISSLRLVWQKCGTEVDIQLASFPHVGELLGPGCPESGKTILSPATGGIVAGLAAAIERTQRLKEVAVEIALPAKV